MEKEPISDPVCKSVFQDGAVDISRERLTERWIAFINEMEQNSGIFDEESWDSNPL